MVFLVEEGEPGVHGEQGGLDGEGQGEAQKDPKGGASLNRMGQEVLEEEGGATP